MEWESGQDIVSVAVPDVSTAMNMGTGVYHVQRTGFSRKNKDEVVGIFLEYFTVASTREKRYQIHSYPNQTFSMRGFYTIEIPEIRKSYGPVDVIGNSVLAFAFDLNSFLYASLQKSEARAVNPNIQLPSAARVFVDAGAYLWGKDIYFFFVGTGILFSRTLQEGDWGYLDTTSVLGTITQFGYLDYSEDEGTLYILGQDSSNRVKAAKIVLNTLYDYANDGAWLPMIASDGVPAYIKAKAADVPVVGDTLTVTVEAPKYGNIDGYAVIELNGETLGPGTYQYNYPGGTGTFTASVRAINTTTQGITLRVNGATMATLPSKSAEGTKKSTTLSVSPYMASGLTLYLSIV